MKKYLSILFVCFLFTGLAVTNATYLERSESFVKTSSAPEDAPAWAIGNFTGRWGLNVWGHDWFSIGPVNGYYGQGFVGDIKVSRFIIEHLESDGENGTTYRGLFIGPYLLGQAEDIFTGNETFFVGLGSYNETAFRWRIMGMRGPTLFMKGTFNEFE